MFASARLDLQVPGQAAAYQDPSPVPEPPEPASLSLEERVFVALQRSPHVPKRMLRFETGPGCVRLHGVVRSYFQKQMVQEVVRRVAGEVEIVNNLRVAAH